MIPTHEPFSYNCTGELASDLLYYENLNREELINRLLKKEKDLEWAYAQMDKLIDVIDRTTTSKRGKLMILK